MACFCPFNRRNREGQKKEGERTENQEKQGRERERMAARAEGRQAGGQEPGEPGRGGEAAAVRPWAVLLRVPPCPPPRSHRGRGVC